MPVRGIPLRRNAFRGFHFRLWLWWLRVQAPSLTPVARALRIAVRTVIRKARVVSGVDRRGRREPPDGDQDSSSAATTRQVGTVVSMRNSTSEPA